MAKEYIKAIASAVLPTQILDYFLVVGVEQTATEIYSSLDELLSISVAACATPTTKKIISYLCR